MEKYTKNQFSIPQLSGNGNSAGKKKSANSREVPGRKSAGGAEVGEILAPQNKKKRSVFGRSAFLMK